MLRDRIRCSTCAFGGNRRDGKLPCGTLLALAVDDGLQDFHLLLLLADHPSKTMQLGFHEVYPFLCLRMRCRAA